MVNEFHKYGGSEVKNKLLEIMNIIFEKGKIPNDFRKTLVKPLYKKGDKKTFDSVDVRTLANVLSLYGIPDKYIKVVSAVYEKNTAVVKVGNEVSSWFYSKSGFKQGCVLSPFIWIILMDFVLRSTGKAKGY